MLRVVLAVLLTVAVLAVATPAIETGRVQAADGQVRAELARLVEAAERVEARSDPVAPGTPGARRVLRLSLPAATIGTAAVASVTVGSPGTSTGEQTTGTALRWRVRGGSTHRIVVPSLRIRSVRCPGGEGSLRVTGGGTHRLVLTLVRIRGARVVTVSRGFKYGNGTSQSHATDTGRGCRE